MRLTVYCLLVVMGWLDAVAHAEPLVVRYFQTDIRYQYEVALLNRVLLLTEKEFGPAISQPVEEVSLRGELILIRRHADVAFFSTSSVREDILLAVKVPLLQGMLGYRHLLTLKSRQTIINKNTTAEAFETQLLGGAVFYWEDLRLLNSNGVLTLASSTYDELFEKLSTKECDYLARGSNEIFAEQKKLNTDDEEFVINPHVAFYYPLFRYFFVARSNPTLANRIEKGLALAKADGSFREIFNQYFSEVILKSRQHIPEHIFFLTNPNLSQHIPSVTFDWWLPKEIHLQRLINSRAYVDTKKL